MIGAGLENYCPNSKRNKGKGRNKYLPKTPQTLGGPNKEKTTKEVAIAKKKRSTKGVFFILCNLTFVNYFFNYVIRR